MDWNTLEKRLWRNHFRLANVAISALVLAFAIAASAKDSRLHAPSPGFGGS